MTHTLAIEYDDEVLFSTGMPEQAFNEEARLLLAAKLYELGRLSSGKAAAFCGKGRVDFLLSLPRVGVSRGGGVTSQHSTLLRCCASAEMTEGASAPLS